MKINRAEALEILELKEDEEYTEEEIKKQYRVLAMKWHPDKNPGNEETAKVAFQKVNAAYQRLTKDGDTDSDEEDIDPFEFFMYMMREMQRMSGGRSVSDDGGFFVEVGGGFMAGFAPSFASRGGGGRGPSFGAGGPGGRGRGSSGHTFFEEVSDDEDDDDNDYNSEDDSDDGGEYSYYKAQEKREYVRQQAQQQERQQRAEELRAKQLERQKLSEEDRRKNEERIEAEARARAKAQEEEVLYKIISRLPRPTMAERTEISITLSMARLAKATGGSQLPKGCLWELEERPQAESAWRAVHSSNSTAPATADGLVPGTKYVFRARAGRKLADGSMEWGKYSEESFYATMGRTPVAVGQPVGQAADSAGQPGQSKKGRRRDATAAASKKPPQKTEEVDLAEAKRRLKAEKEKEAAVKAAMDRAAADYLRETEKLAAQKAETEAMLAEKVRRSRMKARKKEEAAEPAPKAPEDGPHMTNGHATPAAPSPPPPPRQPYRPAPPPQQRGPANNDYSDAFGNVRRIVAGQPSGSTVPGGWDVSAEEEMSIEEAIQLSLALEESERYAKEDAVARSKLQVTEQSFPSLGGNNDGGEWETWEDSDPPVPTANAPPPPAAATPSPSQPVYRETKRAPLPTDSAHSTYASGNRRIAPQGYSPYVPSPPPAKPHANPARMNGPGVYTEEDVLRQSRGPSPAMHPSGYGSSGMPNGVPNGHADTQRAPTHRSGGSVPLRNTVPNGQIPARPAYNPLNPGTKPAQGGPPASYAPPVSSQLPRGNAATPMAALFPHLFPNAAA